MRMDAAPDPEAIGRVLSHVVRGARVVRCEPIDGIGASAVARKEGGYSRTWRVGVSGDAGQVHEFVFRTAGADEFGHDRRADRAANLLLAFDTFGAVPDHVRAVDVGFASPGGLRSLRDAGEPYLVTTYAEGSLYAEDLRRIAGERSGSVIDLERCDALARWLAALHSEAMEEPVAWRRAVRDLLGHGEGIFGIVDAYPPDVPAAPPGRLARIEQRCLEWRWRLRGHPERLRRTHGDFHPFNIVFSQGTRFTLLDASRGGKGDAADDVTALTVNYVFFGLQAPQAWRRGFAPLWRRFWQRYLDASGGGAVLESAAPFLAWRALVLGCPRFYPGLAPPARDALLSFAERALAGPTFDPGSAEDLFA
ncbi:MAG TPA: aminoglycoside phosphotransferase family protein [Anaeromyxobacter sp.]